jgi:hypothetical protein
MKHPFSHLGRLAFATALACLLLAGIGVGSAGAAIGPAFETYTAWGDTNLEPGGEGQIVLHLHNVGDEDANGSLKIFEEVPEGVTIEKVAWPLPAGDLAEIGLVNEWCVIEGNRIFKCEYPDFGPEVVPAVFSLPAPGDEAYSPVFPAIPDGWSAPIYVDVSVDPDASGLGANKFRVEGAGDPTPEEEEVQIPFSSTPASFGVNLFQADIFSDAIPFGETLRQAGDHPFEQRVDFELNKRTGVSSEDGLRYAVPKGTVKSVEVTLPRGMIGNPEATPKCDPVTFAKFGSTGMSTQCPSNTQVGYLNIHATAGTAHRGTDSVFRPKPDAHLSRVAIYNLEPPKGKAADFGFNAGALVQGHIYPELDPAQNYAIRTVSPEISSLVQPTGAEVVFWGVPGDPAHDKFRYFAEPKALGETAVGATFEGAAIRPLLTNPMDCGFDNGGARIRVDSYQNPGQFSPVKEYGDPLNVSGCDDQRIRFNPQVSFQPDNRDASGPTGLDVHLEVPLRDDEVDNAQNLYAENGEAKGISTPPMKKVVTTFPEGMTLSPSAAQGLSTCTAAQISLGTNEPVTCPDSSQYGKLVLHTPILPVDEQPEGFIYIAKQGDNPFHNFLALYLVIQEPNRGILVKVPGRLDLDPQTGQIMTTFDDLPQFPVSDMQLTFKGGVRAGLVNPTTCGTKTIRAEFFSWHDPTTPHVVDNSYEITQKPDGSPCVPTLAQRPFAPKMNAGTVSPSAGKYSPFAFRITRSDDDQEFSQVGVTLPEGLVAKFAGVGACSDAGIAQALSRETTAGAAALEQSDPSCPASSEIGSTIVGTGVGVPLSWVPGKIYLAGPYKGAPMSMVVISPAKVGPYDLGVITVRTALKVNPVTAQATAVSDPFPQIFQGIPVRVRDIRLSVDRPNFTLNPTSCAPKQIDAHVTGTGGILATTADDSGIDLSERFQAADCASLGFAPKLFFHLFGGTHRGAHPKFKATLKARSGDANIAGASVALPHSEFLDQAHIKTVCTRVQFAQEECPAGSVYGFAKAITPLFDEPLQGPVYLRSSSHQLPDLVAVLRGPASRPVQVELAGRIDSVNGGIRNTFDVVPDAPVTEFTLTMQGGKKGLLQNSTDICAKVYRATAKFTGQNGKRQTLHPKMQSACGKALRKKRR